MGWRTRADRARRDCERKSRAHSGMTQLERKACAGYGTTRLERKARADLGPRMGAGWRPPGRLRLHETECLNSWTFLAHSEFRQGLSTPFCHVDNDLIVIMECFLWGIN